MHTDKINNAEVVTATELFEIVNNCKHHWFEGQTPSDDEGNYIIYFTARAMGRFADLPHSVASVKAKEVLFELTKQQLEEWGVKYNELIMGKPHADYFIDDKGVKDEDFFK